MADLRRCIGSAKFGIEGHEAPPEDFPAQPSQKDGLGRMCKTHWREYVNALGKAAKARKNDPLDAGARIAHDLPAANLAEAWDNAQTARAVLAEVEPSVQSQAAARVTTKRAARVAGKVPPRAKCQTCGHYLNLARQCSVCADVSVPGETLAVATRRAKLEAKIAEVGVTTDEGQRILGAAGAAEARGRKPMAEAVIETVAVD